MAKILIVDDEINVRKLYSEELRGEGYQTVSASTVKEAIESVEKENPDLVILDIKLGEESGLDAPMKIAKQRKHLPGNPELGVLDLSGQLPDVGGGRVYREIGRSDAAQGEDKASLTTRRCDGVMMKKALVLSVILVFRFRRACARKRERAGAPKRILNDYMNPQTGASFLHVPGLSFSTSAGFSYFSVGARDSFGDGILHGALRFQAVELRQPQLGRRRRFCHEEHQRIHSAAVLCAERGSDVPAERKLHAENSNTISTGTPATATCSGDDGRRLRGALRAAGVSSHYMMRR